MDIQLEVAFATPEGKRVIELWKVYLYRFNNKETHKAKSSAWDAARSAWDKHFSHICPCYIAYYYWLEHHYDTRS